MLTLCILKKILLLLLFMIAAIQMVKNQNINHKCGKRYNKKVSLKFWGQHQGVKLGKEWQVSQTITHSCHPNAPPECGISTKNRRIVGGAAVAPHAYPWLVSLMLGSKLHCGGAIITNWHVLTAGHCITFGVTYKDLTVFVGMHDRLSSKHETRSVSHGMKHPNFTSNAVRDINDIALLKLNEELVFSYKVRPICLADTALDFSGLPLTVAGWGKTKQGASTSSRYLLEAKVQMVSAKQCGSSVIYRENLVWDTMMCAYNNGKDACQGDSGGPLFSTHQETREMRWYQVGIVSWGIDCAMPDYPGVYTVVSKYLGWIKDKTQDAYYCKGGANLNRY